MAVQRRCYWRRKTTRFHCWSPYSLVTSHTTETLLTPDKNVCLRRGPVFQQHRTFETFLLKIMSSCYFREGQEPLARFSLVSAASLSTCITRAFCLLLSSIIDGQDSGRFWWTVHKHFGAFFLQLCLFLTPMMLFSPHNLRKNSYFVVIEAWYAPQQKYIHLKFTYSMKNILVHTWNTWSFCRINNNFIFQTEQM